MIQIGLYCIQVISAIMQAWATLYKIDTELVSHVLEISG
jgi:hypothetical protein